MISVVMPAYNAEEYMAPAIESILEQTFSDLEFLIVDDGSTDGTRDIACCYAKQDNRVKVITSPHLGNGGARNVGISRARRPWIAVMDADDVALPERLETQIQATRKNPDVVVWGSAAYHIGVDGRVLSVFKSGPRTLDQFHEMRRRAEIVQVIHSTALYRRDVALQIGGYDSRFTVAADAEFFDRMALYGSILSLPIPLMKHRLHGSSLTVVRFREQQSNARYVRERQRRRLAGEPPISLADFRAQLDQRSLLKRLRNWQHDMEDLFYIEAGMAFGEHRIATAIRYFSLSVLINPFFAIPKIWKSRFSPESRTVLRQSI